MIAPRKMRSTRVWTVLSAPAEVLQLDLAVHEDVVVQNKADLLVLDIAALDHTRAAVQLQAAAARQRHLHILRDALDALLLHVILRHQAKIGGLNKVAERTPSRPRARGGKKPLM